MLKSSEKRNHAVCSKMTMAPVALGVEDAAAQALVDPGKVDAPASVVPDKVVPDKVAPDKVAPVLAGVVRAVVEVQQEVVVA
tara:strand:+ start:2184 stop:2429 length:246 start_codon:yes stop_codon:yes gene_type:complete